MRLLDSSAVVAECGACHLERPGSCAANRVCAKDIDRLLPPLQSVIRAGVAETARALLDGSAAIELVSRPPNRVPNRRHQADRTPRATPRLSTRDLAERRGGAPQPGARTGRKARGPRRRGERPARAAEERAVVYPRRLRHTVVDERGTCEGPGGNRHRRHAADHRDEQPLDAHAGEGAPECEAGDTRHEAGPGQREQKREGRNVDERAAAGAQEPPRPDVAIQRPSGMAASASRASAFQ